MVVYKNKHKKVYNSRACNKLDKLEQTLRSILDAEREKIGGKR